MRQIRITAVTLVTGAVAAATIGLAAPAQAVTGWEPGYTPTCATGTPSAGATETFTDNQPPQILGSTWKRYIVNGLAPNTRLRTIGTVTARDICSGVSEVRLRYTHPGGFGFGPTTMSFATPVLSQWHRTTLPVMVLLQGNAFGPLVVTRTRVSDRFPEFALNAEHTELQWASGLAVNSVTSTTRHTIYVVAQTRAASTISRSRIPLGQSVTITGGLSNSWCETECGFAETPGQLMRLQWKQAGSTGWSTIATARTDVSGRYSFTRTPRASGSYRVTFAGNFAGPWLAPVASNTVSVAVVR